MICASCGEEVAADPCPACGSSPRVADRYELVRPLGHGASGVMWLARDPSGHLVAIKELRVTGDPKAVELITREARVLSELFHPRIPAYVEDFAIGSGRHRCHCVVQQYIEGRTLAEVLRTEGRQRLEDATALVEQLCEPLSYLHGLSPPIVHRDLKPENIIVRPDGTLAIVDFGSVRDAWKGTFGGSTVAGTFAYMAPEQFQGDASPASDVYALGVLLVELLSRKDPSTLRDRMQRFHWRAHVHVPAAWEELIASMLSEDPAERPRDALALKVAMAEAKEVPWAATAALRPRENAPPAAFQRFLRAEDTPFVGLAAVLLLFGGMAFLTTSIVGVLSGKEDGAVTTNREAEASLLREVLLSVESCVATGDRVHGQVFADKLGDVRFEPGEDMKASVAACVEAAAPDTRFVHPTRELVDVPVDWFWRPDSEGVVRLRAPDGPGSTVRLFAAEYYAAILLRSADAELWLPHAQHLVLDDVPPGRYTLAGSDRTDLFELEVEPDADCVFRWKPGGVFRDGRWEGTCIPI
jgi:hypothetical protein